MKKLNRGSNLLDKRLLEKMSEYDEHSIIIPLDNKSVKLKGYIAIHRLRKNHSSFGATRFLKYKTRKEALRDVLKLSKLMSYKSALAGLPYGGAKAVIMKPTGKYSKDKILKVYASELKKIKKKFTTGTDVGLTTKDLGIMIRETDNIVGFSVNPEYATAYGIILSLKEALNRLYGNSNYSKSSFAIQGVGKVGSELLSMLVKKGVRNIYIADIEISKTNSFKKKYPFIKVVSPNKIYSQKVDIYCPCALSGALNTKTIKKMKCKIIVGAANNQLESKFIGDRLHKMGILYCPDFVVNAGGLISVVDEYQYNKPNKARLHKRIQKISTTLKIALSQSKKRDIPPYIIVEELGSMIINK